MPDTAADETVWDAPALACLAEAASLIEGHFVAIGGDLDAALERLEAQIVTFDTLTKELDGAPARSATAALAAAIGQIAENARAHDETSAALGALAQAAEWLRDHSPRLNAHARELTILAMYTRLEGSRLGSQGFDFITFTERMSQSVATVRDSLSAFEHEVEKNVGRIGHARRDHEAFSRNHLVVLETAATRLAQTLGAMDTHRAEILACTGQVTSLSRRMQQQVGQAVLALQVGDSTRQRLEHVHALVSMMAAYTGAGVTPEVTPRQRDDVLATGGALAMALMSDAVAEFSHHVSEVVSVFRELAADAKATLQLGQLVGGRSPDRGAPSHLTAIQTDIRGIQDALLAMQTERAASQAALRSVMQSTDLLAALIGSVQALEGEMNMMEVNAALKCHRLGPLGASVGVITRELRGCGQRTAQEAASAVAALRGLMTVAQGLVVDETADALESSDRLVGQALETLEGIERQSDRALSHLQRNGVEVVTLLERSASAIVVNEEVMRLVDAASDSIPRIAGTAPEAAAVTHELLTQMSRIYTMASERTVHARITGDSLAAETAPAELDEFLL